MSGWRVLPTVLVVTVGASFSDSVPSRLTLMVNAQRRRLQSLRAVGTIADTAFQRVEQELDWTELGWSQMVGSEISRIER